MPKILFDYDLCMSCELCVDECTVRMLAVEKDGDDTIVKPRQDRVEGIERKGSKVIYNCPGCSNCRVCLITCPEEAIYVEPDPD